MNYFKTLIVFALLMVSSLCALFSNTYAQEYILDDATRFSELFKEHSGTLSAEVLQTEYLEPGTLGIEIFTPYRIIDAENIAQKISQSKEAYQKGIEICLPGAIEAQSEIPGVLKKVQELLKQDKEAPVFIVFGGNNSGGTANSKGLVLGLEVVCRSVDTVSDAKELIKSFVAHEIVHVYQARIHNNNSDNYLLRQALKEGFADFISNLVLGGIDSAEKQRHEYGMAREAELWSEFRQSLDAEQLNPWMYGAGKDNRPSDLGYWIGKRICEVFYAQAEDKQKAIQELLVLEDPYAILDTSGYNPQ